MARPKKAKYLDTFNYQGFKIPIHLDPVDMMFVANLNDTPVKANNANELKQKLKIAIDSRQNLDWLPVIVVTRSATVNTDFRVTTEFMVDRCFFALREDDRVVKAEWGAKDRNVDHTLVYSGITNLLCRPGSSAIALPCHTHQSPSYKISYLPYTDELWAKLKLMTTALAAIADRLLWLADNPHELLEIDPVRYLLHYKAATDEIHANDSL